MNSDVEFYIKEKVPWHKLPQNVKQFLGNSQKEYEKVVINFRIKNQLKFPRNIVRRCLKEQQYYEDMLAYSQSSLLLYPYHLSSYIVKGLRLTPFQYYTKVLESLMDNEGSYDSLPNFTAADCLRLLGIGRNEYIDLMNQCRSRRKLFRKKNIRELLPQKPIDIHIEPWWIVQAGCIVEDDMKFVTEQEKSLIDLLYDHGAQTVGTLSFDTVHKLYKKGLIYLDVPIEKDDVVVVPPLKGFVMNRVLGDSFENLLYKIFVSIDEHTTVGELAGVLQINFKLVKRAVSLYCRLGFAKKKYSDSDYVDWNKGNNSSMLSPTKVISSFSKVYNTEGSTEEEQKTKIAFLFDSTLTAFLMMGNLSPGLKNHAVTMFEVGKLTDESMDSFLCELEKVSTARDDSEGEARRYFEHALILRSTVIALRHRGLDLVRCESLQSLDKEMCSRLLNKNYGLLVSMAPLTGEVTPIVCENLPHLGPPCPQAHSPWFKLYLYHVTGSGPPSILFTRGTRITKLPSILKSCDKVLVTSWGHDATVIPISNLLFSLNDALTYSPVLVQVHGKDNNGVDTHLIPFPFDNRPDGNIFKFHPAVVSLMNELDMQHTCGYITMIKVRSPNSPSKLQIKDTLSLPLKLHDHLPHLDTPATPSSVEAWLHTISSEGGEFNMKQFSVATLKEEDEDDDEPVGVTNEDCAQMLGNAVDGLDSSESSPSRESEPKVLSPPPSLMIDLSERRNSSSPVNLDEWSLLDCSFGIPLFDETVNKTICKSVVEKLISPQNLQKLIVSNDALSSKLVSFINQVQSWGEKSWSTVKNDNDWPVINVMFNNGQLFPWDGK